MAAAVTDAIVGRLVEDGRLIDGPEPTVLGDLMPRAVVRPPTASLRPLAV